ncbi:MAG TPA: hypothetical protein VGI97_05410 [Gemmatimonadaceae bacterium]
MVPAEAALPMDAPRAAQRYGTVVIVGGGCYGGYYVRQLRRARERGAITVERVLVVDHDEQCAVAREGASDVEVIVDDWAEFFARYLAGEARDADAIVPSPLMPHLLFQWIEQRARERWPERRVEIEMPSAVGGVPWQKEGGESTRYVSFAEWMCPVNCIEPRICPHTREERSWSLPPAIAAHVEALRASGEQLDGPAIFHCTHRAYGVGMIDVRDVLSADEMVEAAGSEGRGVRLLVGTVSHCHGALGVLTVGK